MDVTRAQAPAVLSAQAGVPLAPPVARTTAGYVKGERTGGVIAFRGIPYAAPPVGPLRFASPRPPAAWSGVRDAREAAGTFLQPDGAGSEDALYANVWTPSTHQTTARPVLVHVHGGSWSSGGAAGVDGARLAERGDVVVVTFGHRLGVFGFGLHEELADPETGSYANWGLQDQVAALRWTHDNAAAFGGDPGNITLVGAEAGGASVHQLALLPVTRPLIRRIVPVSPAHVRAPGLSLTAEDARTVYDTLAARFGTTVPGLREVPAAELNAAWHRLFSVRPEERLVRSGRHYRGPVLDGVWLRAYDHEQPPPELPVLSVYAAPGRRTAGPGPADEAELRTWITDLLRQADPAADRTAADEVLRAYREAALAEGRTADLPSLWAAIREDAHFRHPVLSMADRHARAGRWPQYVMELALPAAADPGDPAQPAAARPGAAHEAAVALLFGTHGPAGRPAGTADGRPDREVTEAGEVFADLVVSFARTGVPRAPRVPDWPALSPGRPRALVLGGASVAGTGALPPQGQLRFWDDTGRVPGRA
ncbi:carboxylesterase family protein [Streptomyces sp. NPDC101118]|uniref:carboxylesterase family protein n=1 Tax=Streptomyces sp. NPDC101118 TaxID=3366109 RepID=UPI003815C71D